MVVFIGTKRKFISLLRILESNYGKVGMWKIAGLFFGARDVTGTIDPLNPNSLKRAGFSAARNVLLEDKVPVKVPTQFSMIGARYSPLIYDGKTLKNELTGQQIIASDSPMKVPMSVKNLLPTASGAVGVMAFAGCAFFDRGKQCEFCSVGSALGKSPLDQKQMLAELKTLGQIGYKINTITINTGQPPKPGDDLRLVGAMAKAIKRNYPGIPIAAEVGPFSFKGSDLKRFMTKLRLNYVDTFMINIELIDDKARKKLCPAKPSRDTYLNLMKKLSQCGFQVSTVIQLNFYPELEGDVPRFIKELASIGNVIPEMLISRAVPASKLGDAYWKQLEKDLPINYAQALMVERFSVFVKRLQNINKAMQLAGFAQARAGCVKCGMCNINSSFSKE